MRKLHIYKYWCCLGLVAISNAIIIKPLKAQVIQIRQTPNQESAQTPVFQLVPRQTTPPSTQPLPEQLPPKPLPPLQELLQSPNTTPSTPEQIPPSKLAQTINVKKFEVTGSTVFTREDFAKITVPYTNRPITITELFQLRSEITNLYLHHDYITSGAYIPPQTFKDGVVEIRVVEGRLEDIKVKGTRRLNPNYVRSRLAIDTHKPLNRDRLLKALQILQLNPLIKHLSAELSAGTSPGQSLLEVIVTEADTFNTQIVLDNGRSPAVGSFRRQIQVSEADLLGWGDSINASYTNTDGSNAFDFNYTLPINPRNGTLALSYGTSDNKIIEKPFNVLDIQSNARYYELTLRQPVVQTPTQELALGMTATRRESKASLLNGEIPFPGSGADQQGKTQITAVRFFQDWTRRSSKQVFALRSQFSIGLDAFDATTNVTSPDGRFVAWRGQAQWVRLLSPDTLLILRGDVQFADRPLVPFEQFSLGGIESVRGYRQDALLTDNGIFASAEVRVPIARFSEHKSLLQLTPFMDLGTGWNRSGRSDATLNHATNNTLLSVGLGLRLQLQDRLTARLDWGIPLVSVSGNQNSLQENSLYFSIIANPF